MRVSSEALMSILTFLLYFVCDAVLTLPLFVGFLSSNSALSARHYLEIIDDYRLIVLFAVVF